MKTNFSTSLNLRKKAKRKKPDFVVKASHFCVRIKRKWRFPSGRHSAIRQVHGGRPPLATVGYRSPKIVRGLHPSGLEAVTVHTLAALNALDPQTQGAVLASTLGRRKKLELLRNALEKKITLLNVRNIQQAMEKINAAFAARKKAKEEIVKTKQQKQEEKKKKAEEKKKEEEKKKPEMKETVEKEKSKIPEEKNRPDEDQTTKEKERELMEKTLIKRQ